MMHEPDAGGTTGASAPLGVTPPAPPPSPSQAGGATTGPHESVSGGTPVTGEALEQSEGFEGIASSLEAVAGYNTARPTQESMTSEEVDISGDLATLPPIESLVFEQPETVCGSDDRVRISPATAIPWRWNCQLLITTGDGRSSRGTGWFIGPRTVMTAGHVVHGAATGGWARSIEVIPGMDGASRPFGSQVGTSFRSVVGWTQNADPEYDYGAIILPNGNLGNLVGSFNFGVLSDGDLQNLLVNTAGYPGDKPFGTMWYNAGAITQVTPRRLFYMNDTMPGQSGSCVWRYRSSTGERLAVGVHGYGGCPNKAVRIITPVYNNMLNWKNNP